jgi:hypothetical protein
MIVKVEAGLLAQLATEPHLERLDLVESPSGHLRPLVQVRGAVEDEQLGEALALASNVGQDASTATGHRPGCARNGRTLRR